MIQQIQFCNKKVLFSYDNNNVMVNITEFAKLFPNKNLSKIINSKQIREYITTLSEITNVLSTDLLKVVRGGDPKDQGTWAHKTLAIRIAQILSPELAIWVDMTIENMMRQKMREYKAILEEQKHKLEYYNNLLESEGLLDLSQVGKLTGEGRNNLCSFLRKKGVFNKATTPDQPYITKGYFKMKQYTYADSQGDLQIGLQTFVTQKGLDFIQKLLERKDIPGKIYVSTKTVN